MSRPRYTWRASAETTVMGSSAAHATATAVLPTPVGPTMTGTSGGAPRSASPKSPLQLPARQLHHRGSAVHVVGRERRAEQPEHELPHLHPLVQHPLVRRVLVHDRDPGVGLEEDVGVEHLEKRG